MLDIEKLILPNPTVSIPSRLEANALSTGTRNRFPLKIAREVHPIHGYYREGRAPVIGIHILSDQPLSLNRLVLVYYCRRLYGGTPL